MYLQDLMRDHMAHDGLSLLELADVDVQTDDGDDWSGEEHENKEYNENEVRDESPNPYIPSVKASARSISLNPGVFFLGDGKKHLGYLHASWMFFVVCFGIVECFASCGGFVVGVFAFGGVVDLRALLCLQESVLGRQVFSVCWACLGPCGDSGSMLPSNMPRGFLLRVFRIAKQSGIHSLDACRSGNVRIPHILRCRDNEFIEMSCQATNCRIHTSQTKHHVKAGNNCSCKLHQHNRFFFVRVMTPTLLPVRPGLHSTDVGLL